MIIYTNMDRDIVPHFNKENPFYKRERFMKKHVRGKNEIYCK